MSVAGNDVVEQGWHKFLMDVELAKSYRKIAVVGNRVGEISSNGLLEMLLPSLLYVRLASIVDEALENYIDAKWPKMSKGKKKLSFYERISFLDAAKALANSTKLDCIRTRRNQLAHETNVYDSLTANVCDWAELEQGIGFAHTEMQHLQLVGTRPEYQFHAGREMQGIETNPPSIRNEYFYSLLLNGETVLRIAWPAPGARMIPTRS